MRPLGARKRWRLEQEGSRGSDTPDFHGGSQQAESTLSWYQNPVSHWNAMFLELCIWEMTLKVIDFPQIPQVVGHVALKRSCSWSLVGSDWSFGFLLRCTGCKPCLVQHGFRDEPDWDSDGIRLDMEWKKCSQVVWALCWRCLSTLGSSVCLYTLSVEILHTDKKEAGLLLITEQGVRHNSSQ